MRIFKCEICGAEFSSRSFESHLRSEHNITFQDYYDSYYLSKYYPNNGKKCANGCGNDRQWKGIRRFPHCYSRFCSQKCNGEHHMKISLPKWWKDPEVRAIYIKNASELNAKRSRESKSQCCSEQNKSYEFNEAKAYGSARREDNLSTQSHKYFYILFDDKKFKIGITLEKFYIYYRKNGWYRKYKNYYVFKGPKFEITELEHTLKLKLGESSMYSKVKSLGYTETFRIEFFNEVLKSASRFELIKKFID